MASTFTNTASVRGSFELPIWGNLVHEALNGFLRPEGSLMYSALRAFRLQSLARP